MFKTAKPSKGLEIGDIIASNVVNVVPPNPLMFQVCQRKLRKMRKTLGNAKNRNCICLSCTSRLLEMENRPAFSARPAKLRIFLKERVCVSVMALSITLSIETPTGRTATTGSTLMFSKWSGHARKITSWKMFASFS